MIIDLTDLFNGNEKEITVNTELDLSMLKYNSYNPIKDGVKAVGRLYSQADVVHLDINVSYDFYGFCDRCAEDVTKSFSFRIKRVVVEQLQCEEDDDDYVIVKNQKLNLFDVVAEEVVLFFPSKYLCSDDCKGLCTNCGANLNKEKCNCKKDVDSRMAVLLQLLDE